MTLAGTTGLRLYLGATMGLSLWLRSTFPASAIADAITDDQLFVKLARNILVGRWLGPYSEYTHVKGVFYSLFIDLSFLSGVPLKIFEQAAYLGAALLFCEVVARLHRRRWAAALLFAFLALNPILFHPELARVVREGVYIPLALGVVALAGGGFLIKHRTRAAQIFWLAALGLAGGAFWLTREEALWLGPALLPLFGSWMYRTRREWRRWIVLAVPIVAFLVPVSAVLMTGEVYNAVYDSLKRAIVHTSTFSENAIAMRTGLATLDVLERERLGERALRMGAALRERLRDALGGYEMVKDVRGLGMLSGIEFQTPSSLKLRLPFEAFRQIHAGMFGQVIVMRMFRDWGVLTQVCGNNFMVLKVAPPLTVSEGQLDHFVEAITAVVDLMHTSGSFWTEALSLARRAVNV